MKKLIALAIIVGAVAAAKAETTNVIYANPITYQLPESPCGFSCEMKASYLKPQPTWGWFASNNSPCRVFIEPRRKVCIEVLSGSGAQWTGTNSVTFTPGTNFPCRFNLYFNKTVQTNAFPLTIVNFNP